MDQQPVSSPEAPNAAPGGNVIYSSPGGGVAGGAGKGLSKARLYAIAGAAAVVVLGTAGYVFGFYLPNKPQNVYNSALTNTGKGFDILITYLDDKELSEKYKLSEAKGTFKLESDSFSTDGTFELKGDDKEGTFKGDMGLGPTRVTMEGVAKDVENSESPDLYLKVGGIKGMGAAVGMPALDNLDSQWVSIDHNFFDMYLNQAQAMTGLEATASELATPTREEVVDAAKAVAELNKKYLFTTDATTAVFEMKRYVGAETVEGKKTNRYEVAANKKNLKAYAKELGEALDKSKLNNWAKNTYDKNISEVINTEGMQQSVDDIKDGDTFDLWVNKDTKLIHKIRLSDSKDKKTFMDFGLNFDGGAEKPFFIKYEGEEEGVKSSMGLTFTINTESDGYKVDLSFEQDGDAAMSGELKAEVKPASGELKAEIPEGAISLNEALAMVGMEGYLELLTQNLQQQAALEAELAPFTIEQ